MHSYMRSRTSLIRKVNYSQTFPNVIVQYYADINILFIRHTGSHMQTVIH